MSTETSSKERTVQFRPVPNQVLVSGLLAAIVFLGHRGFNKLLLCEMHISFSSTLLSVLSQGLIT